MQNYYGIIISYICIYIYIARGEIRAPNEEQLGLFSFGIMIGASGYIMDREMRIADKSVNNLDRGEWGIEIEAGDKRKELNVASVAISWGILMYTFGHSRLA